MEKKNKTLLYVVGVLLVIGVGITLAYFAAAILASGNGAVTNVKTANIGDTTIVTEGNIEFTDTDIYPGHKNISKIKITATGQGTVSYHLIWKGENTLQTSLNYTLYKSSTDETPSVSCTKKSQGNLTKILFEECTNSGFENLEQLATGSITTTTAETTFRLKEDESITATTSGTVVYYYVVLEFPNEQSSQNFDANGRFEGETNIEVPDASDPDLEVPIISNVDITSGETQIAITVTASDNNGVTEYWYQLDEGEAVKEITNTHTFTGLTVGQTYSLKVWVKDTAGNSSEVYSKNVTTGMTSSSIIAAIEASSSFKSGTPDFTQVATGAETAANNGIYKVADGMYNGSSYYWRGAATTNHVIFDKKCWRIVRINGDGSIRLIYNGTPTDNKCPGNGANANSVVLKNTAYNPTYNNSKYVGWTYASSDIQRPSTAKPQTSGTAAPLKTALESWYSTNIKDKSQVAKGNFCNDRNTQNNETWRPTGSTQYYAAYQRLSSGTKTPTLSCPDGDVYSLDVGMITADEVQFAGASGTTNNTSYYLYNGQYYWTMSPSYWDGPYAGVFCVDKTSGNLGGAYVHATTLGVRPVINLKADTVFAAGGSGTTNNPYVVS